jgi:hypothetical protein
MWSPRARDVPHCADYIRPGARSYVFLLFEQPADFNSQTFVTPNTSVSNFNISAFAKEVGLRGPIGGTFMLVAPDPCEFLYHINVGEGPIC